MAGIAFEIDASEVERVAAQWAEALKNPDISRKSLQEVGDFFALGMVRKTRRGVDYKGRPFTPYSDLYADYRVEQGRNPAVDLTFSGKMLNALDATVTPDGTIVIFFNVAERGQIAWYHNASIADDPRPRRKMPLRRFVDVDQDSPEWAQAGKVLAEALARQLESI